MKKKYPFWLLPFGLSFTLLTILFAILPTPKTAATSTAIVDQAAFIDELARNTWNYLSSDWATDNHLPWSWRSEVLTTSGDFANPAEIGLFALSWLAAHDMGQTWSPDWNQTNTEVTAILDQLRAWQTGSQTYTPHGANAYTNSVFYQWYWINWNPPVVGANVGDNHLVPSIDNAWLALSLITIREYGMAHTHITITQKAADILNDMDFTLWYDYGTHLFTLGDNEDPSSGVVGDYYSNENRIVNFVARALGQISKDEYLLSLSAMTQTAKSYNAITVTKVAWDGSYFTYASPALFIREMSQTYGTDTILPATQAQIAYAQAQGYPAWGLSDCFDVGNNNYVGQGAPPAATPDLLESRPGLISAHASGLALITPLSTASISNLETISNTFACAYNPLYGFNDSVMVKLGEPDYAQCSNRFTALAQEWIFLAVTNYKNGFIWDYLYRDSGIVNADREMFGETDIFLPIINK